MTTSWKTIEKSRYQADNVVRLRADADAHHEVGNYISEKVEREAAWEIEQLRRQLNNALVRADRADLIRKAG
jgi:hypothetical protein